MAKVKLLSFTPNPEQTIAAAAKLCYSPSDIDTLMGDLTPEKTESFVEMLSEIGHESPIEHASFTFGIEGVSRSFLAQITRHRIASYSVQSQRYVKESAFAFVTPPEIEASQEAEEIFLQAMQQSGEAYERITKILSEKYKKKWMKEGMEEKEATRKAEKKAIEDARFVLPNACDTKMIVTMNARSLLNFFRHRCCNRAQWEIRTVAEQMLRLVLGVAPVLFAKAGPPCYLGACPEGKMSCQQMGEMRRYYKEMHEQAKGTL